MVEPRVFIHSHGAEPAAAALGIGLILFIALIVLVVVVLNVIIWWKVFAKTGWSGAMGLLVFVPIANLVVLLMLAFAEWPIQRELAQLRRAQNLPQPR